MRAKAAIVAGVAAAVLGGGGLALAQTDDGAGGATQAAGVRAAATISRAEAERIALATAGGGLVRETEMEFEEGTRVWKVEVIAQGIEHDIYIDTRTGDVVRHRLGDDHTDDRGDDARHGDARHDDGPRHDIGDDHGGRRGDDPRDDDHGHHQGGSRGRG